MASTCCILRLIRSGVISCWSTTFGSCCPPKPPNSPRRNNIGRAPMLRLPITTRLACLLLVVPLRSTPQQSARQPSDPVIRVTVDLVQVDAVVTDSQGRHVADLKPEDFEI